MQVVDTEDLLDRLQYTVGFNPSTSDAGGFYGDATNPNKRLLQALNDAYTEEVELGKINGSRRAFQFNATMTWPASAATAPWPLSLRSHQILELRDDTGLATGEIGQTVPYQTAGADRDGIMTEDANTLRWVPTPSSERTLTVLYMANASELLLNADEPSLIPVPCRPLLVWTAAINLYEVGRHKVPGGWFTKQRDLRFQFWKRLSLGRPIGYPTSAAITHRDNS